MPPKDALAGSISSFDSALTSVSILGVSHVSDDQYEIYFQCEDKEFGRVSVCRNMFPLKRLDTDGWIIVYKKFNQFDQYILVTQ